MSDSYCVWVSNLVSYFEEHEVPENKTYSRKCMNLRIRWPNFVRILK